MLSSANVIGTSKFLESQGIQNSLADRKVDIKKNLIKACTSHYGFRLGFFVFKILGIILYRSQKYVNI